MKNIKNSFPMLYFKSNDALKMYYFYWHKKSFEIPNFNNLILLKSNKSHWLKIILDAPYL